MTTFVLVPGAWLGGLAWDGVATRLRGDGHDVYPVTLSGLGERAAAGSPDTDLDTHIDDIVSVIDDNNLRDVVLVGHSYGGVPVTGAADRRADRVREMVFVDSGPAPNGVAQADFSPAEAREATDRLVAEQGNGWLMPPIAFDPAEDPVNLAGLDGRGVIVVATAGAATSLPQHHAAHFLERRRRSDPTHADRLHHATRSREGHGGQWQPILHRSTQRTRGSAADRSLADVQHARSPGGCIGERRMTPHAARCARAPSAL
jgi:pimeloyl-ACP methyl ester carboxylesterase